MAELAGRAFKQARAALRDQNARERFYFAPVEPPLALGDILSLVLDAMSKAGRPHQEMFNAFCEASGVLPAIRERHRRPDGKAGAFYWPPSRETKERLWAYFLEAFKTYREGVPALLKSAQELLRQKRKKDDVIVHFAEKVRELEADVSPYRPAKELVANGFFDTHKELMNALRDNPWIGRRKPSKNRLLVHVGDVFAYAAAKDRDKWEALDTINLPEATKAAGDDHDLQQVILQEARKRKARIPRKPGRKPRALPKG